MSYDPFDGVLLDDSRPPVSGAFGMMLHLRVARRMAKAHGWVPPSIDSLKSRAQACQELLAQGLFPAALRDLRSHGLDLGHPKSAHSLASLVAHLEAYLLEVDRAGLLEPDAALWRAVDLELKGERGLWIERSESDGPIAAGLRDLAPSRLRALACVPGLGGARFALALRRGGVRAGLFGSSQPLVEWFLDGLEQHGQAFPNELGLDEPEGWGAAPWTATLDDLFGAQLDLQPYQDCFQRALVEGPAELLRHAAEQICAWLDQGIPAQDISVLHPEPQRVGPLLAPILAAEGIALQVRGGLLPLIASEAWSPLWAALDGLRRLDPCAVSAGLRTSRRDDLRRWANHLAEADQTGARAFAGSIAYLPEWARSGAQGAWKELADLRDATLHARDWAARLEALAGGLRLPMDPDDFFSPLGLLKEAWGSDLWTFPEMLTALQAFLETARSTRVPRSPGGLRLLTPDTVLEDWPGARATLILDLSEGAWPGHHADHPDLDWNRKAAINHALLQATAAAGEMSFPPALQRFWLPRSEHGEQTPRTFQREAYAFNKVLAMTRERLVVLSPAADAEGRPLAQGPFWNALEGAAEWTPPPEAVHSRLRWLWDGREPDPRAEARARSALATSGPEALAAESPSFDRSPEARGAWLKGRPDASPTALEMLATCPFRSLAERVWGLASADPSSRVAMAVGSLAHRVMEAVLTPFVGRKNWPAAFLAEAGTGSETILSRLRALWETHRESWLRELAKDIPQERWPEVGFDLETLLPNLAAALALDAAAPGPTRWEIAFLYPGRMSLADAGKPQKEPPLQDGWTRTLLALEGELGPVELDLGNGKTLAVTGTIDRIERWEHAEDLSFLRVMDYKTSKQSSLKAFAAEGAPFASHLQTPLYLLIAEAVLGAVATAALLPLREEEPEPFTRHLGTLAADSDWRQRLRGNLARLAARLDRGDFPATPGEHCRRCELAALCGRPVDVTVETDVEDD